MPTTTSYLPIRVGSGTLVLAVAAPTPTLSAAAGTFALTGVAAGLTGGTPTYPTPATVVTPDDTVTNFAASPTILSAASGNWSSTSTWDLGRVPQAGDVVGIKTTHVVTYDVSSTAAIAAVGIAGKLAFSPSANTKLTVQSLLVYGPPTLGAGNYGELEIGTTGTPIDPSHTAEVVWTDTSLLDPNTGGVTNKQYSNGLLVWGALTVRGAAKTAYTRTAAGLSAGATTLDLATAVSGWAVGDRLLIPDSQPVLDLSGQPPWHDEVRAASGLTGTSATVAAPAGSIFLGSDHLDGAGAPRLCLKSAAGAVTVIGAP